jgi:hypothetical protein
MNTIEINIDTLLDLFEQKELTEEFDHRFCQALTEVFNAELASIMEYNILWICPKEIWSS